MGGFPILALHRLAQQAAQAEEAGVGAFGQRLEGVRGHVLAPGESRGLGGQQQGLRRVAEQETGAAHLDPRGFRRAGGQRDQGAGHRRIAIRPPPVGA